MVDPSDPFEVSVRQLGSIAAGILDDGRGGRVSALFDSSFYLELGAGLVCIGNRNLAPLWKIYASPREVADHDQERRVDLH